MNKIIVEVSVGELLDKISILEIKKEKIKDPEKLKFISNEHSILKDQLEKNVKSDDKLNKLFQDLKEINAKLWVIEDHKRDCEKNKDFGDKFIKLSRDVHFLNDDRAKIKLEMNNINQIISWKAIVYHFTCTSSRGKDWWKKEEDMTAKVNWQKYADNVEMKRFIRKWGYFGHDYYPRYDVSLAIDVDCPPEINFLLFVETNVNQLILNDKEMVRYIQNHLKWEAVYYSNNKLGHIPEEW